MSVKIRAGQGRHKVLRTGGLDALVVSERKNKYNNIFLNSFFYVCIVFYVRHFIRAVVIKLFLK